jgi:hypothetical protein
MREHRLLVVGMNPSSYVGPERRSLALSRLGEWMNYVGVRHFSFVNASPNAGKFRMRDVQWDVINDCLKSKYHAVVAIGNVASRVLERLSVDHFSLPHPSGLNRKLNDADYVERVLRECRDYVRERRDDN